MGAQPGLWVPETRLGWSGGCPRVACSVVFRSLPFVVRLVVARVGLLLASGDRRDAEIRFWRCVTSCWCYRRELVLEVQKRNDVPPAIAIVIRSGQRVMLPDVANRFFRKVEFDPTGDGDVRRLHPAGPASAVVIDPLVCFGRPTVDGVAPERLWELFDAGDTVEHITDGYEIAPELLRSAVAYEEQLRSLVA